MAKPFNIVLSTEHREMLETIRRHEGLRSEADVVRLLIEQRASSGLPSPEVQAIMKEAIRQAQLMDGHGKPAKVPKQKRTAKPHGKQAEPQPEAPAVPVLADRPMKAAPPRSGLF